jgi:hypothetical protein
MHRKKRLATFPSPAHFPFLARESLVSDIPAEDGNVANLFYSVAKPLDSPNNVKVNFMFSLTCHLFFNVVQCTLWSRVAGLSH